MVENVFTYYKERVEKKEKKEKKKESKAEHNALVN